MYPKLLMIALLLSGMLVGCNLASTTLVSTPIATSAPTLEFVEPTPIQPATPSPVPSTISIPPSTIPLSTQQEVLDRAAKVIAAVKDKDMTALSGYVHPQLGLRFSPYAFIKDTDLVFPADKIASLITDNIVYSWGAYDGSGTPIDLTFADYYSKFIYDVNFANAPEWSLNRRLGVSTSIDNIFEFYQSAMFVEFYFPGFDPQYEGMDWRSLRLVFMEDNHTWYLVGIIHDQWTT